MFCKGFCLMSLLKARRVEQVLKSVLTERSPGVCFTGLAENHLILFSVYESKNEKNEKLSLLGATAVLVNELENSQELPLLLVLVAKHHSK